MQEKYLLKVKFLPDFSILNASCVTFFLVTGIVYYGVGYLSLKKY